MSIVSLLSLFSLDNLFEENNSMNFSYQLTDGFFIDSHQKTSNIESMLFHCQLMKIDDEILRRRRKDLCKDKHSLFFFSSFDFLCKWWKKTNVKWFVWRKFSRKEKRICHWSLQIRMSEVVLLWRRRWTLFLSNSAGEMLRMHLRESREPIVRTLTLFVG